MPRLRDLAHGLVLASVEDSKQFINSANSQGLKRYAPLSMMVVAHKKSHGTNVVVVNNQSVNTKMAANLFFCHVIGCLQQQHSFRGISCGLCL